MSRALAGDSATHSRVLQTTREMIRERGVESFNIRDLSNSCAVSVPTLYKMFGSKEGLVYAAVDELYREHLERVRESSVGTGLTRILDASDLTGQAALDEPVLSRLIVQSIKAAAESFSII